MMAPERRDCVSWGRYFAICERHTHKWTRSRYMEIGVMRKVLHIHAQAQACTHHMHSCAHACMNAWTHAHARHIKRKLRCKLDPGLLSSMVPALAFTVISVEASVAAAFVTARSALACDKHIRLNGMIFLGI